MNERTHIGNETNAPDRNDERSVAKLLNLAGPRARISPAIERRVHAKVYGEWRRSSVVARSMRWAAPLALAAAILLAVAIGIRAPDVSLQPIGSVALVTGDASAGPATVAAGSTIHAGDSIRSGAQGISIRLNNGVSIRLREDSELAFADAGELTLASGGLYADTGQTIYRSGHLVVHTPTATTTDIGTQFMVTYSSDTMSVAVREGIVDVASSTQNFTATAGEKLTVKPGADVTTEVIPTSHESWEWAEELAPPYDIENRSLLDFLKWFARETGRELSFASDDVRMSAMRTRLHGSIADMTPLEAANSVLSSTAFRYRINQQNVEIDK